MNFLLEFEKYDPRKEYLADERREINLDRVRRSKEYRNLIYMGFEEETSHQQDLNNTLKFVRKKNKQREKGHDDVFYTIHPTGTVRRYNPVKSKEIPQGEGNDIKKYPSRFSKSSDYLKALRYLIAYLKRKEERGDYR
jgi:hypothetical protein